MPDIIKKVLTTFAQGFLFGLGFCIASWALYLTFYPKTQAPPVKPCNKVAEIPPAAKKNEFTFRNVEEIKRNGSSYFIGLVKNNGSSSVSSGTIEVNLFFKDKFVDQYSTYFTGDIGPGEERYFKVTCECKETNPIEHDSYKIAVVGGY